MLGVESIAVIVVVENDVTPVSVVTAAVEPPGEQNISAPVPPTVMLRPESVSWPAPSIV
jgi:hypothetical protein